MRTSLLAVFALSCLAGCATLGSRSLVPPPVATGAASTEAAGHGAIGVAIRWPGYDSQAIPLSTIRLDLELRDAGNRLTATASIARPAATASFALLPVGSYKLLALARRTLGDLAASGSAEVRVIANRKVSADLTLVPTSAPRLDMIDPERGDGDTPITLFGANLLPPPGGTYSVLVDGLPVPNSSLQKGEKMIILTRLPSWAGLTASLSVSVDGLEIPADQVRTYTRQVIDHLTLTPSHSVLAREASQSYEAIAWKDVAEYLPDHGVAIAWTLTIHDPAPDPVNPAPPPLWLVGSNLYTGTVPATATLRVTAGGKSATASVIVQ